MAKIPLVIHSFTIQIKLAIFADTLEIEGVPVKAILTTSNAVLYVTERLILG